jgi:hypothetical protein
MNTIARVLFLVVFLAGEFIILSGPILISYGTGIWWYLFLYLIVPYVNKLWYVMWLLLDTAVDPYPFDYWRFRNLK